MYRSGIYSLRRGLSMRSVFGPSRLVSSSSTFGRPVRGPSMKTAGAAVTAGCLLGFALCGSLVALEDKKKLQKEESSPVASSEAPETSEVQQEPATEDSAKEGKPQAAYDPDTGEINWDCPCLGGMAQGPCGEEFKAAFSCFVYSEDEPKGIDCIEKFKGMQDCFRKYPEHYAEQIKDEEEAAKVAADMESHNDQLETIPETQQTLPEESTPMKQQEADFEPLLEEDKKEVNKDDAPVAEK